MKKRVSSMSRNLLVQCAVRLAAQRDGATLPGGTARPWKELAVVLVMAILLGAPLQPARAQEQPSNCRDTTTAERLDVGVAAGDAGQSYPYPYRDPYLATMMAAAMTPNGLTPGIKRQVVHVPVLTGRNTLPSLEGRGRVSVALYRQARPAPLLFIVPGIGASPYFGFGPYFAALFHGEGFHVVILPSPMHWNFALAASRSGVPGYVPDDARDLYGLMQKTLDVLRERHGLRITSISFMGASLGALDGAYLSVIDDDRRRIGIQKYLLVNPPPDLAYALGKLETWGGLERAFGPERSDRLRGRALAVVEAYSNEKRDDSAAIARLARRFS